MELVTSSRASRAPAELRVESTTVETQPGEMLRLGFDEGGELEPVGDR